MKAGSSLGEDEIDKKPVLNGSDSGETGTTATPSPKKGGRGNGKKRGRPVKEEYDNDTDGDGEWMEGTPKKARNGSMGGGRRAQVKLEKQAVEEDEGSDGASGENIYV